MTERRTESPTANHPRVVCHMVSSLDGRIVLDGWPDAISAAVHRHYEEIHASYEPDAWMCGRVTLEPFAGHVRTEEEVERQPRGVSPRDDFRAPGEFDSFAFALDPSGRLAWESSDIDGDHVVAILSERVSDEYLALLRSRGVSYILADAGDIDLAKALQKVGEQFGVRTLMLEGGGRVNGAMLRAGLIDEISLLIAPVADGRVGVPTLFDSDEDGKAARGLRLESLHKRDDDIVWARYRVV